MYSYTVAVCNLACQHGGTLNGTTCTCDCADGYDGDTCESECYFKGMILENVYERVILPA